MGTTQNRMISDLRLANRASGTIEAYVRFARAFVRFHMRPAETLGEQDVRSWLHHLQDERHLSIHSIKMAIAAVRWLYVRTLHRPEVVAGIPWPRVPKALTATLTVEEVRALIAAAPTPVSRAAIQTAYATGLRISEVVSLTTEDLAADRGV